MTGPTPSGRAFGDISLRLAAKAALGIAMISSPLQSHAQSGPFGLSMGMSVSRILALPGAERIGDAPGAFFVPRPPQPHPDFESIVVSAEDSIGLCKVTAIGKTLESASTGAQLRNRFDQLEIVLTGKYGRPLKLDRLSTGSIWNEPNDWMMGIRVGERTYAAVWLRDSTGVELPDWASAIGLEAVAQGPNKGYLKLSYEGRNFPRCAMLLDRKKNDPL